MQVTFASERSITTVCRMTQERNVRGTIGGKEDVIVNAEMRVNPRVVPAYGIDQSGSHTLQRTAFQGTEALRARLIEATVEAIADGSGPRLHRSRSLA
jgi:hypothetical protein